MIRQVSLGRLALFATEHDWNTDSLVQVEHISRQAREIIDNTGDVRVGLIYNAGHSLHAPNNVSDDEAYRIKLQYQNTVSVVETGVHMFDTKE